MLKLIGKKILTILCLKSLFILTCVHDIFSELQPKIKDWLLASVDGKAVGLIPANYVKVLGKRRGTNTPQMLENNRQIQSIPNTIQSQTGSQSLQPDEFNLSVSSGQYSSQGSGETVGPAMQNSSEASCCSKNEIPAVGPSEQCCSKGLPQTPSALNLEKQVREGFTGDNSNLDSILPEDDEQR